MYVVLISTLYVVSVMFALSLQQYNTETMMLNS